MAIIGRYSFENLLTNYDKYFIILLWEVTLYEKF